MRAQYIAIEGVIGAGKTTLTKKMADHFGGGQLLELHDENPFLPDFYKDAEFPDRFLLYMRPSPWVIVTNPTF